MIDEVKRLSDRGTSIRLIADELQISVTTAWRLLQMWEPPAPPPAPPEPQFYAINHCIYITCTGCSFCSGRPGHVRHSRPETLIYGHTNCPDDCSICGPRVYQPDDPVDPVLKERSARFFIELREWLIAGKLGPRPKYPGARYYQIYRNEALTDPWPLREQDIADSQGVEPNRK